MKDAYTDRLSKVAKAFDAAVMPGKSGAAKKVGKRPSAPVAKRGAIVTKPTEGSRGASVVLPEAAKNAAPAKAVKAVEKAVKRAKGV